MEEKIEDITTSKALEKVDGIEIERDEKVCITGTLMSAMYSEEAWRWEEGQGWQHVSDLPI